MTGAPGDGTIDWVVSSLLAGLRIAPVFALAQPFSLTPTPVAFRVLFGLGVAAGLTAFEPAFQGAIDVRFLVSAAAGELMIGLVFVLGFQLAFAAIAIAGRMIDVQAGYGLATLIDPTTQAQTPLLGTLFAYAAGAIFFGSGGAADLLGLFSASLRVMPIGAGVLPASLGPLAEFFTAACVAALGAAGAVVLSLFLADLAIAALSRTVPQMNVLVLGFQVKALLALLVTASTFGFAAAMLARLMRMTLSALPGLI